MNRSIDEWNYRDESKKSYPQPLVEIQVGTPASAEHKPASPMGDLRRQPPSIAHDYFIKMFARSLKKINTIRTIKNIRPTK